MSTVVVIATTDPNLADSWERQLPSGKIAIRYETQNATNLASSVTSAVVILDAVLEEVFPENLRRCPTVFVGEPRSIPFEHARFTKRAKVFLSYEESLTRLQELLPILEEIADKQSII